MSLELLNAATLALIICSTALLAFMKVVDWHDRGQR